jgi:hypothetical protein
MIRCVSRVLLVGWIGLFCGCLHQAADLTPVPDSGISDAGLDAGSDAGRDAGVDAGPDAGPNDGGSGTCPGTGPACMPGVAPDLSVVMPLSSSLYPTAVVITSGDLNGDGLRDLVFSSVVVPWPLAGVPPFGVTVMLALLDGGFSAATTYGIEFGVLSDPSLFLGSDNGQIAIGDLNGDGLPDVAMTGVVNGIDPHMSVLATFMNLGGGLLGAPTTYDFLLGTNIASVAIGDFNGDGAADIVLGLVSTAPLLLLNEGDGGFAAPTPLPVPLHTDGLGVVGAAVQDFNCDGLLDMAFGLSGGIVVLLNEGDGGFETVTLPVFDAGMASNDTFFSVAAIPPGNGLPARLIGAEWTSTPIDNTIVQVFQYENGEFLSSAYAGSALTRVNIAVSDLNADCIPDIVISGQGISGPSVILGGTEVMFGLADGSYGPPQALAPDIHSPGGVAPVGSSTASQALAIVDSSLGSPPAYDAWIVSVGDTLDAQTFVPASP